MTKKAFVDGNIGRTFGQLPKTGHFYLGKNRIFPFWVENEHIFN